MHPDLDYVLKRKKAGAEIILRKNADYADSEADPFANFTFAGVLLDWAIAQGARGFDLSFISLLATKLARVINLRAKAKDPAIVEESVEDTLLDMANYCDLWAGKIRQLLGERE